MSNLKCEKHAVHARKAHLQVVLQHWRPRPPLGTDLVGPTTGNALLLWTLLWVVMRVLLWVLLLLLSMRGW